MSKQPIIVTIRYNYVFCRTFTTDATEFLLASHPADVTCDATHQQQVKSHPFSSSQALGRECCLPVPGGVQLPHRAAPPCSLTCKQLVSTTLITGPLTATSSV